MKLYLKSTLQITDSTLLFTTVNHKYSYFSAVVKFSFVPLLTRIPTFRDLRFVILNERKRERAREKVSNKFIIFN